MEQKKFHIVKINSASEFIINAGTKDGTKKGDKFKIIGVDNQEIIDPITQESLGIIEASKGTITVTHVFEKMSIASAGTRSVNALIDSLPIYKHERIRLNVDLTQVTSSENSVTGPIQIGDEVVKIAENSQDDSND